jgi:hypothetical protein
VHYLRGFLPPTKMSRALFALHLDMGIARKYSGNRTVDGILKGYEMRLGNTVSVHDSRYNNNNNNRRRRLLYAGYPQTYSRDKPCS